MFDFLPAQYRTVVYAVLASIGVAVGALQVGYLAAGHQPTWLDIVLAVYGFLSASVHKVAKDNVPAKADE